MEAEHDIIYLTNELDEDELHWCQDKLNDDDNEYLLSTPARRAAPELLKALHKLTYHIMMEAPPGVLQKIQKPLDAAIAVKREAEGE